jgi:GDPmannose 4,6-dehydratase
MMLQQHKPQDFVIAAGMQYSVRQFIEWTSHALGKTIRWAGAAIDTVGYWGDQAVVKIAPRYFRPTEVETLLGDPAKAKAVLGA